MAPLTFLFSSRYNVPLWATSCWYHVKLWMPDLAWGYETWLYAAFPTWAFDRLARIARVLKNGIRRATVADLGGGYARVDVAGVRWGAQPGMHAYTFFPTLQPLRPWENNHYICTDNWMYQVSRQTLIRVRGYRSRC